MLEWTEPVIPESGIQSNRSIPFEEYAEFINPEVNHRILTVCDGLISMWCFVGIERSDGKTEKSLFSRLQ